MEPELATDVELLSSPQLHCSVAELLSRAGPVAQGGGEGRGHVAAVLVVEGTVATQHIACQRAVR